MSLINQMLKDLEARRSHPETMQQEELLAVQVAPEPEPCTWQRPLLCGGLLLVILGGFGWWGYCALQPTPAAPLAAVPVVQQASVVVPVAPVVPVAIRSEAIAATSEKPIATIVAAPATVVPSVSKVERPMSREEHAEATFQRALASQGAGARATMERELRQALEQDPSHFMARETLAAVLYRAGRLDEAKQVLRGGISETSAPLPLRKILARILLDQGEPEEAALALVQGGTPTVVQETEFHQLLAAIYQRTGQFTAAAQTYKQMLGVDRKNGVWWLGLGLALESGRSFPEAKEAYRTALEDPSLQPGLEDFVRSRLAALAAGSGD